MLGGYVFNNVVCISGFIQYLTGNFFPVLVEATLQGYFDSPTGCEENRLFTYIVIGF